MSNFLETLFRTGSWWVRIFYKFQENSPVFFFLQFQPVLRSEFLRIFSKICRLMPAWDDVSSYKTETSTSRNASISSTDLLGIWSKIHHKIAFSIYGFKLDLLVLFYIVSNDELPRISSFLHFSVKLVQSQENILLWNFLEFSHFLQF